jgi:hypothetical protein
MGKNRFERLKWFMDFMAKDLDSLAPGSLAKIIVELDLQLRADFANQQDQFSLKAAASIATNIEVGTQSLPRLKRLQNQLRDFFEDMIKRVKDADSLKTETWTRLENLEGYQDTGGGGSYQNWLSLAELTDKISISAKIVNPFEVKYEDGADTHIRKRPDVLMNSPIQVSIKSLDEKTGLIIHFINSMAGLLPASFRQCPECKNWYIHTSKREKIFCSNKCAARKVARERRQRKKKESPEEYEKELRENAKRARRSYEQNVEYGKPARRPYKYKEED